MDLKEHPFFSLLDASSVDRLAGAAEVRHFGDGEEIFHEGDKSDSIYLVLSGSVEICKRDPAGGDQYIASAQESDYFGDFGVLDGRSRSASAVAVGDTVLARITKDALFGIFSSPPDDQLLRLVSYTIDKVRRANERYVEERLRAERMTLVGQMANEIFHDFKNPFNAIIMAAGMIRQKPDIAPTKRFCELIEEQTRQMTNMVEEVLEFSRGETTIRRTAVHCEELFDRFERLNRDYMASRGAELTVERIDKRIKADPDRLMRVLQNLVNNAVDSFKGEPGHITIRATAENGTVTITVADDGPGIPLEIQPSIFEAFATHGKKTGIGLGMAITKSIVEAHGGTIGFETEPGKGTTFIITLPEKVG